MLEFLPHNRYTKGDLEPQIHTSQKLSREQTAPLVSAPVPLSHFISFQKIKVGI
jgi:hypothetical protein